MYIFERNKLYAQLGADLVDLLKQHKCYIAGGAITSLFCNREINDIDIYFRDEKSLISFIYDVWDENHYVVSHTKKATLIKFGKSDVQLVHFRYFDDAQSIFDTFDFTVCMGAFDFATEEFVLHDLFLQHNSQRILKFNKGTAFPIVSLLRVQKYRDKGYKISKPEFIRIALTCMSLDITSYAQLKEQMGGMYGVNYDKLFKFDNDTPFDIETVIDAIADLYLDDDYFKQPEGVKFSSADDIVDNIVNRKPRYFQLNGHWYKINHNYLIVDVDHKPDDAEIIDGAEYVNGLKLYKFVQKREDGHYFSYYDKDFEYVIGEVAEARGESKPYIVQSNPSVLYLNELQEVGYSTYKSKEDKVLIEIEIGADDWDDKDCHTITVKRCRVLREVPHEEYARYL